MSSLKPLGILLLILALGAFLRIYGLGAESFWFDEIMSIYFAKGDIDSIINPPSYEVHIPPLYYILLHFWIQFFGTSEFAARLLSAIFGIFSIPVLYKLGKTLFDYGSGLYGALILAISMFHIKFCQEARMYSLLTFTTLISMLLFVKSLKEDKLKFWIGYVIGSVLMLYSHLYGFFILLFQNIFFILYWKRKIVRAYFLAQLAIFLLFLPWLSKILKAAHNILGPNSPIAWIPRPSLISLGMMFFEFSNSSMISLILFGSLSIIGIMKGFGKRLVEGLPHYSLENLKKVTASPLTGNSFGIVFCILWISIPTALSVMASLALRPIYLPKYLIIVSPAFYLLVAKGLTSLGRSRVQDILLLIILFDSLFAVTVHHYGVIENEQWREAARYIEENAGQRDLIIVNPSWATISFNYYFKGSNEVKGLSSSASLKEIVYNNQSRNVWLILLTHGTSVSEEPIRRELEKTHMLALEKEYYGIKIYYYLPKV